MRRETQNILLVLLGGALLKISFNGTYLRYVKAAHQWLLILAGVVMIGLAAVSIVRELLARAEDGDGHGDHDHPDHNHPARSAWLLMLPVLAVFLVAPPALGADTVNRDARRAPAESQPTDVAADGTELFPPLPGGDPVDVTLTDFSLRAAWDSGDSLTDRRVRLTGFVVHDGDDAYVARIAIACCAADAYPVKVRLRGGDLAGYPDDSWVQLVATVVPDSATKANEYVPTATVHSVQPTTEPEDPYEH
jgi:uncharacterized repeat protein (TIGR03943 family)